jgi:hypothetical protein
MILHAALSPIFIHCKYKSTVADCCRIRSIAVKTVTLQTSHRSLKTYPLRNKAPHHEGVWENGVIPPCILNFCTRWRWVVSFTPRLLYPGKRSHVTNCIGVWVGPKVSLNAVEKRKIPCSCQESNPCRLSRSHVAILIKLSRLTLRCNTRLNFCVWYREVYLNRPQVRRIYTRNLTWVVT